ncbi:hypothetical protein [Gottfriedia acidiceleris]|uniref:hypothetical protein n=1 Tax=Gottfriedia acidiceleris TaxID=371036 RepID=UPI00101C9EA7|nr:hypothetical protein [Gottfriedia acidiceleris]
MTTVDDLTLNEKINKAIMEAIEHLKEHITFELYEATTHKAILTNGWNNNIDTIKSIAKYLVSIRASALDTALNICSFLLDDTPEGRLDILTSVFEIVGENPNSLTETQIVDERNPWLAEGLWHLCMFLSKEIKDIHPNGDIIAIGPVHVKAKDHGLDGIALYENNSEIGLTLIESKAYKNDPNRAINKALGFFKEIDNENHTTRIRQDVNNLRSSLPFEKQRNISGAFWKRKRTYIPNPHYDSSISINWSRKRTSFNSLLLSRENIIIMPNIIAGFDDFFTAISNEMRNFARSL